MQKTIFLVALIATIAFGQIVFVSQPSVTRDGENWKVEFTINQNADVEVSIINPADSTVVRHLAAGVLGSNPPPPLAPNTLSQSLAWDGTDDFGDPAPNPENLAARVRAGMSMQLVGIAGEMLDKFPGTFRANSGLVLGRDGSVFLQGILNGVVLVRQYDSAGRYHRTVFPPPATLPPDSVAAYGVNTLPGSGWVPKTTGTMLPAITTSLLNNVNAYLLPIGRPGELVVSDGNSIQLISEGGACLGATRPLISSPALPGGPGCGGLCGPRYFTASYTPDYLYFSGIYLGVMGGGCFLASAITTGFWGDGQVFRVNRETGVVTPWLKLDSVPEGSAERLVQLGGGANTTAAIHGVAIDTAEHVFVCDRLHRCIGVYDTNAVLIGRVPVRDPDLVALSKRTGALYVLTRHDREGISLIKFSGWDSQAVALDTILLTQSVDNWAGSPALTVTENGNITNIWAGYFTFGFRMYSDNGTSIVLSQDFGNPDPVSLYAILFDRLALDPRTETLYWGTFYNFKISDWNNPTATICSTSSQYMTRPGSRVPSGFGEMTVSPRGYIYGYNTRNIEAISFSTPVRRYTPDFSTPMYYGNTGGNASTFLLPFEASIDGIKHTGMDVSWQRKIAVSTYNDNLYGSHDNHAIYLFPDTGYAYPETSWAGGTPVITNMGPMSSGVRFDAAGNIYAGTSIHGPDWQPFSGLETDRYSTGGYCGSIVKYAAGTTGSISGNTAVGAAKVYPQPYGTFAGGDMSYCICRSPNFDVDPYGRLYIPFSTGSKVSIADNAGNTILTFGQYGNTDARGGLSGPGRPYAEPSIPLAWPTGIAASEDYVYVGDYLNQRVVRIRKVYELDNFPDLTSHNTINGNKVSWKHLAMTASPNPFNPASNIRISMPAAGKIRLAVYNANGRLVRELAQGTYGPGMHDFAWRGENAGGLKMASGLYLYRLLAGGRALTIKTVLTK